MLGMNVVLILKSLVLALNTSLKVTDGVHLMHAATYSFPCIQGFLFTDWQEFSDVNGLAQAAELAELSLFKPG